MINKGIILAGGSGTRLYPLTHVVSKQLMPVYDKPMIYYPICVLMMAGITDILVITTPEDGPLFQKLLGDGSQWGIQVSYAVQPTPGGLAQAFIIGRDFIQGEGCSLILGDNIFHGHGLEDMVRRARTREEGATVFAYWVNEPKNYGVVDFDSTGLAKGLEEKPKEPKSNYAVTGLYFYDKDVSKLASSLQPSVRGELEITDLNRLYLEKKELNVEIMGRGFAWLDTGSHDSLLAAANFIETMEKRQGLKVCCPEEVAYLSGMIDAEQLKRLAEQVANNNYGKYLMGLMERGPITR
ncbi:MAG: glucose-1-phosphate thymidylyltransferase RfbA [Nitrospinota bacterium]|nr:glucose-1-phosphate thymidylyltransferase RfbA [Nitrospinota bacterium]